MQVLYKCKCMAAETTVTVPDRPLLAPVEPWMEIVTICLGYDHGARSPHCRQTQMEYAKIPMPEGSGQIGTPVIKH